MRYLLSSIILIIIGTGCTSTAHAESPSAYVALTPDTWLTPFKVTKDGQVVKQKPVKRASVVKSGNFKAVVVASWCPYCQDLLRDLALKKRKMPDLIIFADDEITKLAQRAIEDGEDKDDVRRAVDQRRRSGKMLAVPEKIAFGLPYYSVPAALLDSVGGVPAFLKCSNVGCTERSLRDKLDEIMKEVDQDR